MNKLFLQSEVKQNKINLMWKDYLKSCILYTSRPPEYQTHGEFAQVWLYMPGRVPINANILNRKQK